MQSRKNRVLAMMLTGALVMPSVLTPVTAALASEVRVQNHFVHTVAKQVSGIKIDKINKPAAGKKLDAKAQVTTHEGERWQVPVLWVDDDLQMATKAKKGHSYLPVVAFYLPDGISIQGDSFKVNLSDSVTRLFGGKEIISVYDADKGITYILPASLKDLFASKRGGTAAADETAASDATAAQARVKNAAKPSKANEAVRQASSEKTLIDLYCSKTARDAFTDSDLAWLLDLIINRLQPQAVNLLIDSFPSFRAAAERGQIGREIGFYVYYQKGDDDGIEAHKGEADALAYVGHDMGQEGEVAAFRYLLAVNIESLAKKDKYGDPVVDRRTGKLTLIRKGSDMVDLENTMVHELFHALMDDYNRTGMIGIKAVSDLFSEEGASHVVQRRLPIWFMEGTASSVENVYMYRNNEFDLFRRGKDGNLLPYYTTQSVLDMYLNGTFAGRKLYCDLMYSSGVDAKGRQVDKTMSAYVGGYCATLFLADLAARKDGASAITYAEDGSMTVSTDRLRLGLDSILARMHAGETLDEVVQDISPVDGEGKRVYKDTDDFERMFIKGVGFDEGDDMLTFYGDKDSVVFVTDYLNCLLDIGRGKNRAYIANGSILRSAYDDYESPLDASKKATSDYLKIAGSSDRAISTVPDSIAFADGGKSDPDKKPTAQAAEATSATQAQGVAAQQGTTPQEGAQGAQTGAAQTQGEGTAAPKAAAGQESSSSEGTSAGEGLASALTIVEQETLPAAAKCPASTEPAEATPAAE